MTIKEKIKKIMEVVANDQQTLLDNLTAQEREDQENHGGGCKRSANSP